MFYGKCEGAFARAGQSCEPNEHAFLLENIFSLLAVNVAFMPDDVRSFNLRQSGASCVSQWVEKTSCAVLRYQILEKNDQESFIC